MKMHHQEKGGGRKRETTTYGRRPSLMQKGGKGGQIPAMKKEQFVLLFPCHAALAALQHGKTGSLANAPKCLSHSIAPLAGVSGGNK